ncbi:hypothetical protein STVIR_0802 [Streptomyces viridochromogenes Tue57]|uniref:Uncharacterized protein n=1 Tax=Streptomyces viridochromogenes Tue57 TaxID=1160705 RepID=L8PL62_STRVR|nr:hypothetical protein STVIR_0802 [Streptomyces viridochromogenes Tue57]
MVHRDRDDEGEREQAQYPAGRDTPEQASRGESYRCHIRRGSPRCANGGFRQRGRPENTLGAAGTLDPENALDLKIA